ncbi:MAG: SDR family NAD(P)-dependent oxidoreductase [Leptonema sp. (in: bacteria)]
MKFYTLITGASSGIGKELAMVFAENHYNLVLVARNEEKLNVLKKDLLSKYEVDIRTYGIDLSLKDSAEKLYKFLKKENLNIQILINNAGFGTTGGFLTNQLEQEIEEIQVNVISLVKLTHYIGNEMLKDSTNQPKYFYKILNVGSTAGFQPGPFMNIYYSTKAFVLFFSEALFEELKEKNIFVSVLCPGPVKTNFFERANMQNKITKLPMLNPKDLAIYTYKKLMQHKIIIIPGIQNRLGVFFVRITPRSIIRKLTKYLNQN